MIQFILGLLVGGIVVWLVMRGRKSGAQFANPNAAEMEARRQNLAKVMALFEQKSEIANNDVERLLGVSNATAERYLNELERQGQIRQVLPRGKSVTYQLP